MWRLEYWNNSFVEVNSFNEHYATYFTSALSIKTHMKKILLKSNDGARVEIIDQGAHVCSWIPSQGEEQLFLSRTSEFREGAAIRGGVPIIFPQFAGMGVLPKHGFARTAQWQLLSNEINQHGAAQAHFELQENIARLCIWPYVFRAEYIVSVAANYLQLELVVHNTGDTRFSFTSALHSYFKIADLAQTRVHGLQGLAFRDSAHGQILQAQQQESDLMISTEIDRIYANTHAPIIIEQAHQHLQLQQRGFTDAVVWNPGAEKGAQLSDLEPNGYQHMLCVEAARIHQPITLDPGMSWSGMQRMQVQAK
jgi:glucose-6-phosphate 1-epimerase